MWAPLVQQAVGRWSRQIQVQLRETRVVVSSGGCTGGSQGEGGIAHLRCELYAASPRQRPRSIQEWKDTYQLF